MHASRNRYTAVLYCTFVRGELVRTRTRKFVAAVAALPAHALTAACEVCHELSSPSEQPQTKLHVFSCLKPPTEVVAVAASTAGKDRTGPRTGREGGDEQGVSVGRAAATISITTRLGCVLLRATPVAK